MTINFADTPEGEKISKELDRCLEKRLAYEDEKMWSTLIKGAVFVVAVLVIILGLTLSSEGY